MTDGWPLDSDLGETLHENEIATDLGIDGDHGCRTCRS